MNTYADNIRRVVPKGGKIDYELRHVSRSGLTHDIAFYYTNANGERSDLTYNVANLLGYSMKNNGVRIGGFGFHKGWDVIDRLSREIHNTMPGHGLFHPGLRLDN